MASQLPYLPPLKDNPVASVAQGTAQDVAAAPTVAGKAGAAVRGAVTMVPAASAMYAQGAMDVARGVYHGGKEFLTTLFGGTPPPAITTPPAAAAPPLPASVAKTVADVTKMPTMPAISAPASTPATQQPVVHQTGGVTSSREGNNVAIVGNGEAPPPAAPQGGVVVVPDPVSVGLSRQAAYAAAQRGAVLDAAAEAAATGNQGNASLRYMAALHALPALSGPNNIASTQAQLAADRARTAELGASNIRTTEAMKYETDVKAKEIRRNAQPTVIAEEINPDPTTRPFAPTIKKYGFVERGDDGKIVVKDMQGNVVNAPKPAAAPVPRDEFIRKNKAANPGMSEADIGKEYDKKYGGK